jgi:hypothetical protein
MPSETIDGVFFNVGSAGQRHRRKQILQRQQQWLLLHRHNSTTTTTTTTTTTFPTVFIAPAPTIAAPQ